VESPETSVLVIIAEEERYGVYSHPMKLSTVFFVYHGLPSARIFKSPLEKRGITLPSLRGIRTLPTTEQNKGISRRRPVLA